MSFRSCASAALAAILLAATAHAHHNMSALFDFNDRVTLDGTLTRTDWRNPHIFMYVDATEGGAQVHAWSIEGPPPGFFRARDINRTDIEAAIGQAVTVEVSRARDGSRTGLLRTLTLPDGTLVSACPQNC